MQPQNLLKQLILLFLLTLTERRASDTKQIFYFLQIALIVFIFYHSLEQ